MSEGEAEGSIQVEDTSEKENIEPPLKKAKTREDIKIDRLGKLEARLNDILSCTVCLDLPTKSVFQVRIELTTVYKMSCCLFKSVVILNDFALLALKLFSDVSSGYIHQYLHHSRFVFALHPIKICLEKHPNPAFACINCKPNLYSMRYSATNLHEVNLTL